MFSVKKTIPPTPPTVMGKRGKSPEKARESGLCKLWPALGVTSDWLRGKGCYSDWIKNLSANVLANQNTTSTQKPKAIFKSLGNRLHLYCKYLLLDYFLSVEFHSYTNVNAVI